MAPYSYCSLEKSKRYVSGWEPERKEAVGEKHARSYLTLWIVDGKIKSVVEAAEDPRLFLLDGTLYAVVIKSVYSGAASVATVPWLFALRQERQVQLHFEGMRDFERNWAPFTADGRFFFLYSVCPRVVLECDFECRKSGLVKEVYPDHSEDDCRYDLRATSALITVVLDPLIGPELLGVAHRTISVTGLKVDRLYLHTFFTLQPTPPFAIQRTSRFFRFETFFASELDMVQFASGLHVEDVAVQTNYKPAAKVQIDYGVADCAGLTTSLSVKEVNALFDDDHSGDDQVDDGVDDGHPTSKRR